MADTSVSRSPHAAVSGLQWGDEGKGKIVDLLARQYDVLAGFDKLQVCTGYKLNGKPVDAFVPDAAALEKVEPVYRQLNGFADEITQCTQYDQLPGAAKAYIELIEQFVGVRVGTVSVGPKRSQTIVR